jgi:hypothetical protein
MDRQVTFMDWIVIVALAPILWPIYLLMWFVAKATGRR